MDIFLTILGAAGGIGLVSLMSAGLALGTHILKPSWSRRRRILGGATIATLVPMSVLLSALALEADLGLSDEGIVAWSAMLALTLALWGIFCVPAAWWAIRKVERAEAGDLSASGLLQAETEEPALIGADG